MPLRPGDDVLVPVGVSKVWGTVLEVYTNTKGERVVVELADGHTIAIPAAEVHRVSPTITLNEVVDGMRQYLSTVGRRRVSDPTEPYRTRLTPVDFLKVTLINLQEIQKREEAKSSE